MAVVTFIQHFRLYLLGRHFHLRTDHGSLTWLQNFKNPEGQLARWITKLQEYDFTILHRKSSQHTNADALSWLPCSQCGRHSSDSPIGVVSLLQDDQTFDIAQLQFDDTTIGPFL